MSDDGAGGSEDPGRSPVLEAIVPLVMLIVSVGYAWSLRAVPEPELNLLLLRPLFVVIWILLFAVLTRETIPALLTARRSHTKQRAASAGWDPGTEGSAGLVVAATLVYAAVAVYSDELYVLSTAVYLAVTSIFIGERRPLWIIGQTILGTATIYAVMVMLLGIRF